MNEQNITLLIGQLQALGLGEDMEYALRTRICFQPVHFTIHKRMAKEKDVINFHLYFERISGTKDYTCKYYDAVLRKEMEILDLIIGEINIADLDKQMSEIDWNMKQYHDDSSSSIKQNSDWKREKTIESIVSSLQEIETTEEGKSFSSQLKLKHWGDLLPEEYIESLSTLKSHFEISQRFYLFPAQENITIEEAYRFLTNKWLEKRLYAKRKGSIEQKTNAEEATVIKSTVPGSKRNHKTGGLKQ